MPDFSTVNHAFRTIETMHSLVSIPGLMAAAMLLLEIRQLIQDGSTRKSECKVLAGYTVAIIWTINVNCIPKREPQIMVAVSLVEKVVTAFLTNLRLWKNYPPGMAFFNDSEIQTRLERHRLNLDNLLNDVGLSQEIGRAKWSAWFIAAQSEDEVVVRDVTQRQANLNREIRGLKQVLLAWRSPGNSDFKADKSRASMTEQLYRLRTEGSDSKYLSNSDLELEVQKIGERPFHSGSMYELWQCVWLERNVVSLKVFRGKQFNGQPTKEAQAVHDTAKGLQYLHGIGILHDALQGSNVLVNDDGNAVVADFSLTKFTDPNMVMTRTGLGPSIRWCAPETINEQILSTHADVYSWAMTALEIISGLEPYYTITSFRQLSQTINQHLPPMREEYVTASELLKDDRLWNLMLSCWAADPEERPSMDDVVETLDCITPRSEIAADDISRSSPFPLTGVSLADGEKALSTVTPQPTATNLPMNNNPSVPSSPKSRKLFPRALKAVKQWIRQKTKRGIRLTLCGST
ncbi:hypothetical protein FRB96_007839 [Tulasnella sp. 330]|nr:hypothetical protein FRB96_007839 [Tulasnella sp. 330]